MSGLLIRSGYDPIVAEDMGAVKREVTNPSPVTAMKYGGLSRNPKKKAEAEIASAFVTPEGSNSRPNAN